MAQATEFERITIDPEVCLGQPTIRGMRITVAIILRLLANGKTASDIVQAYPELESEDIAQVLNYVAWLASGGTKIVPTVRSANA